MGIAKLIATQIFINVSNHPSSKWASEQLEAAKQFGEVIDIPFPNVAPEATEEDINQLATDILQQIDWLHVSKDSVPVVHIMGEMTLVYNIVTKLKSCGVTTLASTTVRDVVEKDGVKTSVFKFCKFRKY